ncbi:MAG TPA: DUF1499 domain-containing protein [Gammaproteobacteria bacterium]|nr:DUF1499 domain-containing protein [Gammaproteobacteria bacterium]
MAGNPGDRLRPCPESPNCVCSEDTGSRAYVPPLVFDVDPVVAWQAAAAAVRAAGGDLQWADRLYLHATFSTRIFRFKDDLELRLDRDRGVIQVRCGSRVGYSDLGVNRRRVRRLRRLFERQLYPGSAASSKRT